MRVLVLGGTGSIGRPIVRELIGCGHEVTGLARSPESARKLTADGARTVAGDIRAPEAWLAQVPPMDAVIHAAATFKDDEQTTDRHLLDRLLPFLATAARDIRLIYTGGCWLYGESRGIVTTEESPFDPLPADEWSIGHIQRVLCAPAVHPIVIHPAMVYEPNGGVFARFHADALAGRALRVAGGEHVRWPLVHAEDLATLYRLALEHSPPGESYIAAAIDGMAVGRIARAFARRFHAPRADPEIISADALAAELGEWGRGYALDQLQSGDRARRRLGWAPLHRDPETEIAAMT